MSALPVSASRRGFLRASACLTVSFTLPAWAQLVAGSDMAIGKTLDSSAVDGFLALHADGSVTVFCGKVDLGTGLRIAIRQMVAEELGVSVAKIALIEGDTALTPDQGPTAGSTGIMRGGVQLRQAAATARQAILAAASARLNVDPAALEISDGVVAVSGNASGVASVLIAELMGDRPLQLKLDPKAKLRDPRSYTVVGQSLPRPDIPAKLSGRHPYVHDFRLPGMLHGRVIRPPTLGAKLLDVDAESIKRIPGVRIVHIEDFLGVAAADEWDAVQAARLLKTRWSETAPLVGNEGVRTWLATGPFDGDETLIKQGDADAALNAATTRLHAEYYWPIQTHGSMGPSCAVADVKPDKATIWTASQATHRFRPAFARFLALPEASVRLIYLDGAGCYGMNGHDDAAADAALMSRELRVPVRVQWMRQDEHGWDPKGPPQLLAIDAALNAEGGIAAWRTEMWLPRATANLPSVPLVGPASAGLPQTDGLSTGLITQNGDSPYVVANQMVLVHWHKDAPLRPSNIRAPGKIANSFAVESMTDELAAAAGRDALEFRLAGLSTQKDTRGVEVLKRTAELIEWKSRSKPQANGTGRGIAYVHYKQSENHVAVAMDVEVDRNTGAIRVLRVACAHDCGLMINPDGVHAQVEGNLLQTLSRTLFEEITFDQGRVTSLDWASYPILKFPDVPELRIALINRPELPPLGAGEAAAAPVAAALANAVYDAVGVRLRTVPFTRERVLQALKA